MTCVKVLQHHIEKGTPCRADLCPVAQALLELFPGSRVQVEPSRIMVHFEDHVLYAQTPQSVLDFIQRVDRFGQVEPFEFAVEFAAEGYRYMR